MKKSALARIPFHLTKTPGKAIHRSVENERASLSYRRHDDDSTHLATGAM